MAQDSRAISGTQVSIIIPTYNESQNILKILKSIGEILTPTISAQAIVVDDNSPDGTGKIVENYLKNFKKMTGYTVDIIHRTAKKGLSSAILNGIQHAKSDTIVVMDSDFSHPPQVIPRLVEALKKYRCDIVVASRYVKGGGNRDKFRRKLLSKIGNKIAKSSFGMDISDPMSGFFAFKRNILRGLKFDAIGYKMLLEILVKTKGTKVREIPYIFTNRELGASKFGICTMFEYTKAVWKLYRYGKSISKVEKRQSVHFLSKAARFYTVGATGLIVNYLMSLLFVSGIAGLWYLYANVIGIIVSITTNFVLNKSWTFEDKDFRPKKTLIQYSKFIFFSSLGIFVQLAMVYLLIEEYHVMYPLALLSAVILAAFSNFILNKKWTFKEKLWN